MKVLTCLEAFRFCWTRFRDGGTHSARMSVANLDPNPQGLPHGLILAWIVRFNETTESVENRLETPRNRRKSPNIVILPRPDGGSTWGQLFPGSKTEQSRAFEFPSEVSAKAQDAWLKAMRATYGWDQCCSTCGVSRRTWEGWEGKHWATIRTIPYAKAALLALHAWEITAKLDCHE